MLLRQLDAITVEAAGAPLSTAAGASTIRCPERGQSWTAILKRPFARVSISVALQCSLSPKCRFNSEMAERKQRPLFSKRAVAKLGIVARQGEVANGVQPFRMNICRVCGRAFHTIRA